VRKDYKSLSTTGSPGGVSSNGNSSGAAAADAVSPEVAKKIVEPDSTTTEDTSVIVASNYDRVDVPQNCTFSIQKVERDHMLSFKCPRHACFNCFEFHGATDSFDLTACLACPRAFHTNCILPGSRFNSMCVLCPLHPDAPLPSHDVRLNPKVAGAKKAAPTNEYSAFWDMLAIPEEMPDPADPCANHFKLQVRALVFIMRLAVPQKRNACVVAPHGCG
jgi:hypothetical protein